MKVRIEVAVVRNKIYGMSCDFYIDENKQARSNNVKRARCLFSIYMLIYPDDTILTDDYLRQEITTLIAIRTNKANETSRIKFRKYRPATRKYIHTSWNLAENYSTILKSYKYLQTSDVVNFLTG